MTTPTLDHASPTTGFSHEAYFYSDPAQFLEGCLDFVREGLTAGESVLSNTPNEVHAGLHALLHKVEALDSAEWRELQRHPEELGPASAHPSTGHARSRPSSSPPHRGAGTAPATPMACGVSRIPLGARIVALADAYDVIVRGRPYQAPRSHRDALMELIRCSGSQFDPALVPLFIEETERVEAGVPNPWRCRRRHCWGAKIAVFGLAGDPA